MIAVNKIFVHKLKYKAWKSNDVRAFIFFLQMCLTSWHIKIKNLCATSFYVVYTTNKTIQSNLNVKQNKY